MNSLQTANFTRTRFWRYPTTGSPARIPSWLRHSARFALLGCLSLATALCSPEVEVNPEEDPRSLLVAMSEKTGTPGELRDLRDVQYRYIYRDKTAGKEDISIETYYFQGELSHGEFLQREHSVMPDQKGKLIQGHNGATAWATLDGKRLEGKPVEFADFLRETNYYWFAMFTKLLDPGLTYKYEGRREAEGVSYHLVRVGFEEGVGDAQDDYLLYVNPETYLADYFLFTIREFGMNNPFLMEVEYAKRGGLLLPTYRKYSPANWEGEIVKDQVFEQEMKEIEFGTGVSRSLFDPPEQNAEKAGESDS